MTLQPGDKVLYHVGVRDGVGFAFDGIVVAVKDGWATVYDPKDESLENFAVDSLRISVDRRALYVTPEQLGALRAWIANSNVQTKPRTAAFFAVRDALAARDG